MFAGTCACAAVLAFAATDCAEATQIIVDVRSDACPAPNRTVAINSTGIAVGSATTIDNARDAATKEGCERNTDRVGTLTIYPSGENDETVTFRVVSGVEVRLDECKAKNYAGCITQHRTIRFQPRTTQTVLVKMSLSCLGKTCPAGQTCEDGVCVSSVVLPPGTDAGSGVDGTVLPDGPIADAPPADAPVDGAPRGCSASVCNGPGMKCVNNVCVIDCSYDGGAPPCQGRNVCPGDLDCRVVCNNPQCSNVECRTLGTCVMQCSGANSCNGESRCVAARCDVDCTGDSSCQSFRLGGADATIRCPGKNGNVKVCSNVDCTATTCRMACDGNGCSGFGKCCRPPGSCIPTSNTTDWDAKDATGCAL